MEQNSDPREILQSLIEKKRDGKDPLAGEGALFSEAWLSLAKQNGCSDELEQYLYDGFVYDGALPFKRLFVITADDKREELLQWLYNGKLYGKNADITFKILTQLLSAFISAREIDDKYTKEIIMRLPKFAYNKDGKPLANASRNVIKYLFATVNTNADFELSRLGLDVRTEVEIKAILNNAVDSAKEYRLKEKESEGMNAVIKWFSLSSPALSKVRLVNADNGNSQSIQLDRRPNEVTNNQNDESVIDGRAEKTAAKVSESASEPNHNGDVIPQLNPVLKQIAQRLEQLELINQGQQERFDIQLSSLSEQIRGLMADNSSLKDTNMKYLQERLNLEREVEQLQAEVADKNVIIAEMREMQSVISRDEENKSGEAMKRLAAKLQLDYQDFCDAQDVPMTVGLGENMRLQLQSVFDILINSGIELE